VTGPMPDDSEMADEMETVAVAAVALHRFYERISYLVSDAARFQPGEPDRIIFVAMAVHEYERATGRPLTPGFVPIPIQVN